MVNYTFALGLKSSAYKWIWAHYQKQTHWSSTDYLFVHTHTYSIRHHTHHRTNITWPSQRSMRGAFSRLALMSLVWNNFPSKYIHGQQCSHGIGCPQASLANNAMSTPLMNNAESWIPRGSRFSILKTKV